MRALERAILGLYGRGYQSSRDVARALNRNHSSIYRAIRRLVEQGKLEKGKLPGTGYRTFMKTE